MPTLQDVADYFDVSPLTIKSDWRPRGMPGSRGKWNLRDIRRWKESRRFDPSTNGASSQTDTELLRRRRVAEAEEAEQRAEKLRLANAQKRGELLDARSVELSANELVVRLKTRFESLPDEFEVVAPAGLRSDARGTAAEFIDRLLIELASWEAYPDYRPEAQEQEGPNNERPID